jgi:hypothetical protein
MLKGAQELKVIIHLHITRIIMMITLILSMYDKNNMVYIYIYIYLTSVLKI